MPLQTRRTFGGSKKGTLEGLYGEEVYTQGIIHTEESTQEECTHGAVYTQGSVLVHIRKNTRVHTGECTHGGEYMGEYTHGGMYTRGGVHT